MTEIQRRNLNRAGKKIEAMIPDILKECHVSKQLENELLGIFSAKTLVPDVVRGYFENGKYHSGCFCDKYKLHGKFYKDSNDCSTDCLYEVSHSIVLLLESPADNEYEKGTQKKLCPIAPAQGATGQSIQLIQKYRGSLYSIIQAETGGNFLDVIGDGKVPLVLCNPVQWQASLHWLLPDLCRKTRNKVKEKMWRIIWEWEEEDEKNIQEYFLKRLQEYSPCIIINACGKYLGCDVHKAIKSISGNNNDSLKHIPTIRVSHPWSWRFHFELKQDCKEDCKYPCNRKEA